VSACTAQEVDGGLPSPSPKAGAKAKVVSAVVKAERDARCLLNVMQQTRNNADRITKQAKLKPGAWTWALEHFTKMAQLMDAITVAEDALGDFVDDFKAASCSSQAFTALRKKLGDSLLTELCKFTDKLSEPVDNARKQFVKIESMAKINTGDNDDVASVRSGASSKRS
jgi:hypothetical protein